MTTMPEVRIDRTKRLADEPGTGHNRWHPDIPPVIRCAPGDETGPVYVGGPDRGDMLVSACLPEDIITGN